MTLERVNHSRTQRIPSGPAGPRGDRRGAAKYTRYSTIHLGNGSGRGVEGLCRVCWGCFARFGLNVASEGEGGGGRVGSQLACEGV
jgi:hypothetical protein